MQKKFFFRIFLSNVFKSILVIVLGKLGSMYKDSRTLRLINICLGGLINPSFLFIKIAQKN